MNKRGTDIQSEAGTAVFDTSRVNSAGPADSTVAAHVDDLTMLVKQLARALKKANPNSNLPNKAMDYLKRKSLVGSPFRKEQINGNPT